MGLLSLQPVRQISPFGVLLFDQRDFPFALPSFHSPLARQRRRFVVVGLEINKAINLVFLSEAGNDAAFMLVDTAREIVCRADIQSAVAPIGENVKIPGHSENDTRLGNLVKTKPRLRDSITRSPANRDARRFWDQLPPTASAKCPKTRAAIYYHQAVCARLSTVRTTRTRVLQ